MAEQGRQQRDLVPGGGQQLGPAGQGGGEAGEEQRVEVLGRLGVVPRQQADQRLDGGAGGRLPQVVLQQLLHQVEAVQVRPGRLPGGQGPQQGLAVLHARTPLSSR